MKKFASFALAALLVTALSVPAAAAPQNFEAASGTAAIDGVMDDAYKAAKEIKIENYLKGSAKTKGTARVLWDSENLYVFFDVTDPALSNAPHAQHMYETDSVEFFVDLASAPGSVMSVNAGQWTAYAPIPGAKIGTWGGRGVHQAANNAKATYAAKTNDNGWTVEMKIPFGADYTPKAGAVIGAAFHINSDEDGKQTRDYEIFAGDAAAQEKAWDTSNNYDKLTLTDAVYVPPVEKPEAPATADMGVITALASLAASGAAVLSLKKRK